MRVRNGCEAEVARQALGDLVPRLAGVVRAMHADVVLLVHALRVGRADELVHAEADILVVGGPVAAQAAVSRAHDDPPSSVSNAPIPCTIVKKRSESFALGNEAGDPEVPGRLVGGIVPALAAVLARQGREERPGLAVVAALEDARRLDADEQPVARARERRHLRDLAAVVVAVGEAFARLLPRLAEIAAAPDGRAVPLARGGGVDLPCGRVVDSVVDGPSLAVRAAQRPVAAVVALEHERALSGCDGQQCLRHGCAPQRRGLVESVADRRLSWKRPCGRRKLIAPGGRGLRQLSRRAACRSRAASSGR